ncbi:hemoglobin embryonic subunit alpha-like [Lampris incognitus]|uniref:hemoglobin embryonic subunit alpha-like n=1 Tax=Lampris incognitus TaxID=2546036 RepID=UPI0024B5AF7B|nr:hemoglobin embryonic subunit alpha-like [Lampris incognitus]
MSLTDKDKATVKAFWVKVSKRVEDVGPNALYRMLRVYPQTKTYFTHWKDLSANSAPLKAHGKVIIMGISDAVSKMDDLTGGLLSLSELHAFKLQVDPSNFKILFHNLMVVLAILLPKDFTPEVQLALDKFLAATALALSERYR